MPWVKPMATRASVYTDSQMAPASRVPDMHLSRCKTMSFPKPISAGGRMKGFLEGVPLKYAFRMSTKLNFSGLPPLLL